MAIGEWGSWRGLVDLGIRQKSLTAGDGGHTGFADCRFAIGGIEAGMEGKGAELAKRATDFALRVVRLYRALPACDEARVIGSQLLPSATSVAANYRAVCKARSRADFISRLGSVEEEADETVFGLEFWGESGVVKKDRRRDLVSEGNQLTAIFAAGERQQPETIVD
jgi:four helix bundle protein